MKSAFLLAYILSCFVQQSFCLLDPISLTIGGGALLGSWLGRSFIKENTYCRFNECCNEKSIPANVKALNTKLKSSLFGQHIVLGQLLPALKAHLSPQTHSRKPLVLSFHGTQGTGKNFVADSIAEALYTHGLKSQFVHKYMGRADFSIQAYINQYKQRINKEVREAIAACPRSLFIFDEVDKMPEGIFEALVSLVDYNAIVDGKDNTQAIFIFLSNSGGANIADTLGKMLASGTLREQTSLSDYEQVLTKVAYNSIGGLKKTSLIDAHVIDHFVPFLPLEKQHVTACARAEFQRWGRYPDKEKIDKIIRDVIVYDRQYGFFATSGCKTLDKKVAMELF